MNVFLFFLIMFGVIFSLMNFYISFLAKKKTGSGIPMFGSLFLVVSLFFIKNKLIFYIICLVALLDTGGVHWFVIAMLWEKIKNKKR